MIDFLAVRKIPLTERPFLMGDPTSHQEMKIDVAEGERSEDSMVELTVTKIRAVVLQDRDNYDKVGIFTCHSMALAIMMINF